MSLDDERVRFYLKHREQIEQWASLRSEAASAIDEWMEALGPQVEELARELGRDVRLAEQVESHQPYPSYRLTRMAWGFDGSDDPPAAVTLEWVRGKATLHGNSTPYVGLRSPKTGAAGAELRASEAVRQTRVRRKDAASSWWIGYAYVHPSRDVPVDFDEYRDALLQALRETWLAYEPHVSALKCLAK